MQPLDLRSPSAVLRWTAELRTQVEDLWGAADDATRPPSQRALGRTEARRLASDAYKAIGEMLDGVLAGLGRRPVALPSPDRTPEDDDADHILPPGEYEGPPSAPRPR